MRSLTLNYIYKYEGAGPGGVARSPPNVNTAFDERICEGIPRKVFLKKIISQLVCFNIISDLRGGKKIATRDPYRVYLLSGFSLLLLFFFPK